jgi:hypothetical protein
MLSPTGACANGLNQLTVIFSDILKSILAVGVAMNNKLPPRLCYFLADSYTLTTSTDVAIVGFVSGDTACCGAG